MSRAKIHPKPDPSAAELVGHLGRLPQQLGIWRAGRHGLYHLLFNSSLMRMMDIARANLADGHLAVGKSAEDWRHATSALIDWHHQWSQDSSSEPLGQDIAAAIRRAQDWRALELIQVGLCSGDMYIAESRGWDLRLGNHRDHAVEVLDIVLEQVTVPAVVNFAAPSREPVDRWFADHAGQADFANNLPRWLLSVTYLRALADLQNRGLTMPPSTDLGGLSLAEAQKCYAFLVARVEVAEYCATILGCREAAIWYSEPKRLREELANLTSEDSADAFIELCSYHPGRSPVSAPLVKDGSLIAIPAALVSPVGFERALLRAASANHARGGRFGNALGHRAERWAERLRSIPGALVAERLPVKDSTRQTIGDLDIAAFDPNAKIMLVFETKWPVDAYTLRESGKVDDAIEIGRRQLLRLRTELTAGASVQWPPGWDAKSCSCIHWWVGTAQQLSTRPDSDSCGIRATSLRLIEHLLPVRSLADLQERLENFPLPRLGVEYELIDQTVRAGRYRITLPAIAFLGEPPAPPIERRTNMGWT